METIDLVVLALYLGLVMGTGWYRGRNPRDLRDYFLCNRRVPWWALLASIVATETSTVTFLSVPAFAFAPNARGEGGDWTFLSLAIGSVLGRVLVVWLFLPAYFRGELFTVYELLERRFSGRVRRAASALFLSTRSLADGIRLMATALVVVAITDWSDATAILLIGLVTVLYTWLGGMRAVIWTDVLQLITYLIGGGAAALVLWHGIPGGWETVLGVGTQWEKFRILDLRWEWSRSYTLWAGLVGGAFLTLATHGTDQMMVQRYLCAAAPRQASRALLVSGLVIVVQFALFLAVGSLLFVYYREVGSLPEAVAARPDRVFAHFIASGLPPGLRGVVMAAVFAAAMSTLSSSLNSLATASVTDFGRQRPGSAGPPGTGLRAARAVTVVWAMVLVTVACGALNLETRVVDMALALASFTNGPVLGLFLLGLGPRRVDARAALAGLLTGLGVMTVVGLSGRLSWQWYALLGAAVTWLGAVAYAYGRPRRRVGNEPTGSASRV